MSKLSGVVGKRSVKWLKAPAGGIGEGEVVVDGKKYLVSWKRDADGVWIQFPNSCLGFDISGEADESGSGLSFRVSHRGGSRVLYGLHFKGEGELATAGALGGKKKSLRVRAQMPGKIVSVLVKAGDTVSKDQPLLVMEAMKMENEIRALAAGTVEAVKISEGQAVESGADLILIGS